VTLQNDLNFAYVEPIAISVILGGNQMLQFICSDLIDILTKNNSRLPAQLSNHAIDACYKLQVVVHHS
jgi:hypothetical protein